MYFDLIGTYHVVSIRSEPIFFHISIERGILTVEVEMLPDTLKGTPQCEVEKAIKERPANLLMDYNR